MNISPVLSASISTIPVTLSIAHPRKDICLALRTFLDVTRWTVYEMFESRPSMEGINIQDVGIVICGEVPGSMNWRNIQAELEYKPDAPNMIVCAENPDARLWAEVLNLGGYAVLPIPLMREEALRTCWLAWLAWERRTRAALLQPEMVRSAKCGGNAHMIGSAAA